MRKGRIKLAILMIAFAVSLFSISKVMGPLIALASGDTSAIQDGLMSKLLPTLFGGKTGELEVFGGNSLDRVQSLLEQSQSFDPTAGGAGKSSGISIPNQLISPAGLAQSPSSSSSTTSTSARIITKSSGKSRPQLHPDDFEMSNVREAGLDPELEESLRTSAIALHMEGRLEEAVAAYHREIEKAPGKPRIHANLAVALFQMKRYDEAWQEVHAARHLGGGPPAAFVKALTEKMPEPKS
jgi:tetratricopeptide (TPR) repeat protein